MSSWDEVGRIALGLPEVAEGQAHEGSPAYDVSGKQFARLRWEDDGREILQFWTGDDRNALIQSNPDAYFIVRAFPSAIFAYLGALGVDELREIVTDSWQVRAPKRLVKAHPEVS
ncbi:hypothetical protein E0H75_39440 [Kribbella capetownensis]|uniref:MmcQ/YjbR family DNA-binding protein n=1 Tax=Kribbella capetownensis TaxID=1572659 RepID=A0A4R0IYB2_9ACTN|nr:MmcQ/YjbR family DNA-binding protein [Kribbella capetownensis]TCC39061.1 hypothetical protein E0H75_39440 [Kribbella capetownensis]